MNRLHRIQYLSLFLLFLISSDLYAVQLAIQEPNERFHPVQALHGMVATQEALATKVGRSILKAGGNAVDASVAVGFALAVTLPRAGNLAGGGFMLVWMDKEKKAYALNYREMAPKLANPSTFIDDKGDIVQQRLTDSARAVGVPGTVAGLCLAHQKFGRLPFKEVIQPAIELARHGIIVTPDLEHSLVLAAKRLTQDEAARKIFFKPDGQPYRFGDRLKQTDLADTLTTIKLLGPDAFYHGPIAQKILKYMKSNDGLISAADLNSYEPRITQPLSTKVMGFTVLTMPLPSAGGVGLIQLLKILNHYNLPPLGVNSAASIHLLTEAMNWVYRDRTLYLGDPKFVKVPLKKLLSDKHAYEITKKIDNLKHTPSQNILPMPSDEHESTETTHYSIVDADGNMVANTYSLNFSFGNAQVVPGTGMVLNNELDDFTIKENVANAYGLRQGSQNLIAPGKQPLSSMTPTLVLDVNQKPFLATGSPGGPRIMTTVLQVLVNVLIHHMNIATAISYPRVHSQLYPDVIFCEHGISLDTRTLLEKSGHKVELTRVMGSAQTVSITTDKRRNGAADPRRPGALALGY